MRKSENVVHLPHIDYTPYQGQWIAVDADGRIVAHHQDLKIVIERVGPNKDPLYFRVPEGMTEVG